MSTKRKAGITKQFNLVLDCYRYKRPARGTWGSSFVCPDFVKKVLKLGLRENPPYRIRFTVSNRSLRGGCKFSYCRGGEYSQEYVHTPPRGRSGLGSFTVLYRELEQAIAEVIGRENFDRLGNLTFFWIHIKKL